MYEEIINNAINAYKRAKRSGKGIGQAVNDMENVYIMVADKNVKGTYKLYEAIENGYNELMKDRV